MRNVPTISETIEAGQALIAEVRAGHLLESDTVRAATVVIDYAASALLKPHEKGVAASPKSAADLAREADVCTVGAPAWLAIVVSIAIKVLTELVGQL